MLQVVIVDDNDKELHDTESIVRKTASEHGLNLHISCIGDPRFFIDDINESIPYDIFILDIEMPGVSGIELAGKVREKYGIAHLIFTTNHVQYSPVGYEVHAERFLLKKELDSKLPEALLYVISEISREKEKFYISSVADSMTKIPYSDIIKIEKFDSKYSLIYTKNGRHKTRSSLSCIIRQINSDGFIFVNKGIIVNLDHINEIDRNRIIHLSYGLEAELSKNRVGEVKKRMMDYYMPQK